MNNLCLELVKQCWVIVRRRVCWRWRTPWLTRVGAARAAATMATGGDRRLVNISWPRPPPPPTWSETTSSPRPSTTTTSLAASISDLELCVSDKNVSNQQFLKYLIFFSLRNRSYHLCWNRDGRIIHCWHPSHQQTDHLRRNLQHSATMSSDHLHLPADALHLPQSEDQYFPPPVSQSCWSHSARRH